MSRLGGSAHAALVARERAYALLSGLVLHGVRGEDLAAVRAVPPLAECLPEPWDAARLGAEHHRLFGLDAPPVESFFLSPDRLLGGPIADGVARAGRLAGFTPDTADAPADHLGHELALLAWLAGARADAARDREPAQDRRIAELERGFLDNHLLRWLPALVAAVGPDPGFYGRVLELIDSLVRAHRSELGGPCPSWTLPPVPDLLDDDVGLRDIARVLCTPSLAGGLLTRSTLAGLGRADRLPMGFGEREQTLANVFRSAARFEVLPATLGRLDAVFADFAAAASDQLGDPWAGRAQHTRDVLARLEARLAELESG